MTKGTAYKTNKENVISIDLGARGSLLATITETVKAHGGIYLSLSAFSGTARKTRHEYKVVTPREEVCVVALKAREVARLMCGVRAVRIFVNTKTDVNTLNLRDFLNYAEERGVNSYYRDRIAFVSEYAGQSNGGYRMEFEARLAALRFELEDTLAESLIVEIETYLRALDERTLGK